MKFEANRLRVESKRANYPPLAIGIAFVEMTEENRRRLKELLDTVSRPAVIRGPGSPPRFPPVDQWMR